MLSPLKLCFCAQVSREMTFEGKECVKEVGLHCFFLTQLFRYPSFLKSVIKHVQKKKKKKNLVSVGLLGNKNSKMHEENHINLSLNNSSQPLATISSHRALSKTNFAILFSLKRKRQFKKKDAISSVKLLFSYNPRNQVFSYFVYIFSSLDIMSTKNSILTMNFRSTS